MLLPSPRLPPSLALLPCRCGCIWTAKGTSTCSTRRRCGTAAPRPPPVIRSEPRAETKRGTGTSDPLLTQLPIFCCVCSPCPSNLLASPRCSTFSRSYLVLSLTVAPLSLALFRRLRTEPRARPWAVAGGVCVGKPPLLDQRQRRHHHLHRHAGEDPFSVFALPAPWPLLPLALHHCFAAVPSLCTSPAPPTFRARSVSSQTLLALLRHFPGTAAHPNRRVVHPCCLGP